MYRTLLSITVIALWTAFAGIANAGCGPADAARKAPFPMLLGPVEIPALAAEFEASAQDDTAPNIVGLWDVKYTSGGQLFDEGYDQFHSDGTEILNDTPNPASGNVCLGVFRKTGDRTYKLHHVFWNFDAGGNLIGRGSWDQFLNLSANNSSYTGTWTLKNYDLSGNLITSGPLAPASGTLTAQRITAQ